ncbi:MAG: saccharopine dehydrogenase family protein [Bernardetiaceae bacterium]
MKYLLYGAYGFTGKLMADFSSEYGLTPTLAGRSLQPLQALHDQTGYPYHCIGLDDVDALTELVAGFDAVLHAAGPFSQTARAMMEACLRGRTHYFDITGELEVFEKAKRYDQAAREAGILLMSGTGFDVVPTDCLAALLHQALPDADHLELAIGASGGGISHGTAQTMLANLGSPGAIRSGGEIVRVPIGVQTRWVQFGSKRRFAMSIPWGDVSTAYHTTKIPNIVVYMAVPPSFAKINRFQSLYNPILRFAPVRKGLQAWVSQRITGPDAEARIRGRSLAWGRVSNAKGEAREAFYEGIEGYTFTAKMSLHIVREVLAGRVQDRGYATPAGVFGAKLVEQLQGCQIQLLP